MRSENISMNRIKVGVCEDDPFTRSTLEASLAHSDLEVSFGAGSAADAIELAQKHSPHAMLIDLHLGTGPSGLDLARALRRRFPSIGLVFLTSFESPRLLSSGNPDLPSGARYVIKGEIGSVEQIVTELQASLRVSSKPSSFAEGVSSRLTARQLEVLQLIAEGATNADISSALQIKEKSLEGTIRRICRALGIESRQNANQRVQMARAYLKATGSLRA